MYQSPSVIAEFGPFVWIQYAFAAGGSSTAVAGIGASATEMAARNASAPAATRGQDGRADGRALGDEDEGFFTVDEGRADRLALMREESPAIREHVVVLDRVLGAL